MSMPTDPLTPAPPAPDSVAASLAASVDFQALATQFDQNKELADKLQEKSKVLDQAYRTLWSHLARIHSVPAAQVHEQILVPTQPMFATVRTHVQQLVDLVPEHRYYQWNNTFAYVLKQLSSAAVLAYFLGTGKLLHLDGVMRALGIPQDSQDRVLLPAEDYLVSLTFVTNEISRLAYTSVTLGDLGTPLLISNFIKDLYAGFQLLNLKNNELRRRFDSIKYDVKRIEEVVYDLYLRGLVSRDPNAATPPGLTFHSDSDAAAQNEAQVGALLWGN